VQLSTRQAVQGAVQASPAFRKRVEAALAAERAREGSDPAERRGRILSWRTIVPMAAAAALTLVWAATLDNPPAVPSPHQESKVSAGAATVEQLIDELVSYHANPPQPEVVEEELVPRFEPQVGVPVKAPSLQQYGARWVGGSVVAVRTLGRRAASLRYSLDGHRVTVYVYDSSRYPLRSVALERRIVRDIPVYVGTRRGYSIAAAEERGVGYAVATDLNDVESAELVAASFR
jgi:hypothetical protein